MLSTVQFNYAEVLQKSLTFYYGQVSGKKPEWNTFNWKSDCCLKDGQDVGLDLTGGYFDCGDHVMFGLPGSYTLYSLALSGLHYQKEYEQIGEWTKFLNILKRGTDFWIKAHPEPFVLYGQIGNGELDHSWWGPPEFMQMQRPAYQINITHPGSDLAASVSTTLALTSIIYRNINTTYSNILLQHATDLFDFANKYRGLYHKSIVDATSFYTSSGYEDELILGSLAMYWATNDTKYSKFAIQNSRVLVQKTLTWAHCWDDASYSSVYLLWKLLKDKEAENCLNIHFNYWLDNIPRTPGGLAWLTGWGSLRYPTATSFLMLMYIDSSDNIDPLFKSRCEKFALTQMNYILGMNPLNTSYLNGFGNKYFEHAHHRGAHGSWNNSMFSPSKNRNRNYALIGGPALDDSFSDDIVNFGQTECCMDMQVGLVGTSIALVKRFNGNPVRNFPPPESVDQEYFISGKIAQSSSSSVQYNFQIEARTGWPPRSEQLCFRYYLFLPKNESINNIQIDSYYNEQALIGSLVQNPHSACSWYIPVCWSKGVIYPQSTSTSRKQVQLTFHLPYNNQNGFYFDRSKDWSNQELTTDLRDNLSNVPIYENSRLVQGKEPVGDLCNLTLNPISIQIVLECYTCLTEIFC